MVKQTHIDGVIVLIDPPGIGSSIHDLAKARWPTLTSCGTFVGGQRLSLDYCEDNFLRPSAKGLGWLLCDGCICHQCGPSSTAQADRVSANLRDPQLAS